MKLAISAGDHSGDIYGEALLHEIRKLSPNVQFVGMGGEGLQRAGLRAVANLVPYSTVGFVEPLKYLFPIYFTYRKMIRLLKEEKPDALLLVDYQGFNMTLARAAKKMGIRTIYFIGPQEWLWGTKKGARKVAGVIDLIIAIFEKEREVYQGVGGNTSYFGHPLPELLGQLPSRDIFCAQNNILVGQKIVGGFPGTREHEVRRHLPIVLDLARGLELTHSDVSVIIAIPQRMRVGIHIPPSIRVTHDARGLLKHAEVALGKPGTVQMEALFLGTPYIPFYKVSPLTYFIGKRLLRIQLPFYTMLNLLAGKEIVPEFIQDMARPDLLFPAVEAFLNSGESADPLREAYASLRGELDRGPVLPKIAENIVSFIAAGVG